MGSGTNAGDVPIAARFGVVIGVARVGQADALRANGAHVVVGDPTEVLWL